MRISRHFKCTHPFLYTSPQRVASSSFYRQAFHPTRARNMSASNVQIENSNPTTAPGVGLSAEQKTLVGSVLDLFQGKPSKEMLQLWTDEATFEDPITVAQGRKKYEPQWVCRIPIFPPPLYLLVFFTCAWLMHVVYIVRPPTSLLRDRAPLISSDILRQPHNPGP